MPKFLDAPSWYDSSENEVFSLRGWVPDKLSAAGSKILNSSGGAMEFGVLYKFEPTYDTTTSTGVISVMYQKNSSYVKVFDMNIGIYPSDNLYYRFVNGGEVSTGNVFYLTVYNAVVESEASSGSGYNLRCQSGSNVVFIINDFAAPLNTASVSLMTPGEQSLLLNGGYAGNNLNPRSFYAPTTGGSSGQLLYSGGATTSPKWKHLYRHNIRAYRTTIINDSFAYSLYLSLINFDDTEYMYMNQFGTVLFNMNCTSVSSAYPVSGTAWKTGTAAGTSTEIYNLIGIYASSSTSVYLVIQTLAEGSQDVTGSTIYIASYGPSSFTDNMTVINAAL